MTDYYPRTRRDLPRWSSCGCRSIFGVSPTEPHPCPADDEPHDVYNSDDEPCIPGVVLVVLGGVATAAGLLLGIGIRWLR